MVSFPIRKKGKDDDCATRNIPRSQAADSAGGKNLAGLELAALIKGKDSAVGSKIMPQEHKNASLSEGGLLPSSAPLKTFEQQLKASRLRSNDALSNGYNAGIDAAIVLHRKLCTLNEQHLISTATEKAYQKGFDDGYRHAFNPKTGGSKALRDLRAYVIGRESASIDEEKLADWLETTLNHELAKRPEIDHRDNTIRFRKIHLPLYIRSAITRTARKTGEAIEYAKRK